jgi:endonuclease/exonuclease/phosphatase family metal-dependent hydrolase
LVCLHLDLLERGRKRQLQSLVDRVSEHVDSQSPLIVAGDFNDWNKKFSDPLSEQLNLRESAVVMTGDHARTFPSWRPFLPLDRVYVRKIEVKSHEVLWGAPWRKLSDHAAIVVELEILKNQ